jgi:hypothetical protein
MTPYARRRPLDSSMGCAAPRASGWAALALAAPRLTPRVRCGTTRQHLNKNHRLAVVRGRPGRKTCADCCLGALPTLKVGLGVPVRDVYGLRSGSWGPWQPPRSWDHPERRSHGRVARPGKSEKGASQESPGFSRGEDVKEGKRRVGVPPCIRRRACAPRAALTPWHASTTTMACILDMLLPLCRHPGRGPTPRPSPLCASRR